MPTITNKPVRAYGDGRSRAFVTRSGNELRLGAADYRFSGCNIWWLGLTITTSWVVESNLAYPSKFKVDDGYRTAQMLGCNMVRAYSLMPTVGNSMCLFPDGATMNETTALIHDYAVARAADYGIRLLIPLSDPYGYYVGSITDWASTDAFKSAITLYLNRINTCNGLRYGDDPTILAWETGNEYGPDAFNANICAHLKSLAPNTLTKSGDDLDTVSAADLADANIDCVGNHYYQGSHAMTAAQLATDLGTADLEDKVWFTGEYDWNNVRGGDDLVATFGPALISNRLAYPGQAWWNLAGHADTFGWAADAGNYVGQDSNNYDVIFGNGPAFEDNQSKVEYLRELAFQVRDGNAAPSWPKCGIPKAFASGGGLAWRGVAGAASYTVERSESGVGFFRAETGVLDEDLPIGVAAGYYRVRAVNPDGAAGNPSNVVAL